MTHESTYTQDPETGRIHKTKRADYTIEGDFEVTGTLTNNGAPVGGFTLETPTGDVDGVNDEFVFTSPPIFLTYQGIVQDEGVDYTVTGSTVTFIVPPVTGFVKGLVSA